MKMPENELVILDIAGNHARLQTDNMARETKLTTLGFVRDGGQLVRPIADDIDRKMLVQKLVEMDALFAAGRDWSPAELVDFYREEGIVAQGYRMITWKGPDAYVILTR